MKIISTIKSLDTGELKKKYHNITQPNILNNHGIIYANWGYHAKTKHLVLNFYIGVEKIS